MVIYELVCVVNDDGIRYNSQSIDAVKDVAGYMFLSNGNTTTLKHQDFDVVHYSRNEIKAFVYCRRPEINHFKRMMWLGLKKRIEKINKHFETYNI